MSVKEGDIVTLVLDDAESDARVVKTYEDQDYVDLEVISGGPGAGVLYQTVLPKDKAGEGSIRHFEKKTAAEQKAIREEKAEEAKDPAPGGKPARSAPGGETA